MRADKLQTSAFDPPGLSGTSARIGRFHVRFQRRRAVEAQLQNARMAAWAIPVVIGANVVLYLAKYFAGEFPEFGVVARTGFMILLGAAIGGAIRLRYRAPDSAASGAD